MEDIFISNIHIHKVRHLENIEIPISDTERKHLILTGKNGSGKTSVLESLKQFIPLNLLDLPIKKKIDLNLEIQIIPKDLSPTDFLLLEFKSTRASNFTRPKGIEKISLQTQTKEANFIQHIVNLKAERSFAKDDGETKAVKEIDDWFEKFETSLKIIFDEPKLKLVFDRKNYNFKIKVPDREEFDFFTLTDGYSSIMNIVTKIMMNMEIQSKFVYDLQGIVLIDEIETHLHIDLQKKILPFLTDFFPNIQFIVSTHSPFVLNSIENAVIYDLENKVLIEDLSALSYEGIVESYFQADKYSTVLKEKVDEYERLLAIETPSEDEKEQILDLKMYFKRVPLLFSPELSVKLHQLESKRMGGTK